MKFRVVTLLLFIQACVAMNARAESGFLKKVIFEEFTGTWCQWCVRGSVYQDSLARLYPDVFIPISVHGPAGAAPGADNYDPMTNNDYVNSLHAITRNLGYPYFIIDRDKSLKGYIDETLFRQIEYEAGKTADAKVEAVATINVESREVKLNTTTTFAVPRDNAAYALAFVVTEDSVNQPGNKYYDQKNGFSGGASGKMGGFENLPEVVTADKMYYRHVVRGSYGGFSGVADAIPNQVKAFTPYTYNYTFTLGDNVIEPSRCSVIVMLIGQDGKIVNACCVRPETVSTGISAALVTPAHEQQRIYSLTGCRRGELEHGMNIVVFKNGTVRKVFRK